MSATPAVVHRTVLSVPVECEAWAFDAEQGGHRDWTDDLAGEVRQVDVGAARIIDAAGAHVLWRRTDETHVTLFYVFPGDTRPAIESLHAFVHMLHERGLVAHAGCQPTLVTVDVEFARPGDQTPYYPTPIRGLSQWALGDADRTTMHLATNCRAVFVQSADSVQHATRCYASHVATAHNRL